MTIEVVLVFAVLGLAAVCALQRFQIRNLKWALRDTVEQYRELADGIKNFGKYP